MTTYPTYDAAHEATNAVLLAAKAAAEAHGVTMAIVVMAEVEGRPARPNTGVEYVGCEDEDRLLQATAVLHGAVAEAIESKHIEYMKRLQKASDLAEAHGREGSALLLDRNAVPSGEER